jgi:STE24 endopeptidase
MGFAVLGMVLFLMVLVPYVIMPLFNKFEPIEDNELKANVKALSDFCDYPVSHIEIVDGSKRSSHSNAF